MSINGLTYYADHRGGIVPIMAEDLMSALEASLTSSVVYMKAMRLDVGISAIHMIACESCNEQLPVLSPKRRRNG